MIVMSATLRPRECPQLLRLMMQRFTRRFPNMRAHGEVLLVQIPEIGRVMVTEADARMSLEFVVADEEAAAIAVAVVVEEIRSEVRDRHFSLSWDRPTIVPVALR